MQHGEEPGEEDGRPTTPAQVELGTGPIVLADAHPQSGEADARPEPAPEPEADALADERTDDDDHDEDGALGERSDGGRGDDDDGVAGDHETDEHTCLEHDRDARQDRPHHRIDALHGIQEPCQQLVHGSSLRGSPGREPLLCGGDRMPRGRPRRGARSVGRSRRAVRAWTGARAPWLLARRRTRRPRGMEPSGCRHARAAASCGRDRRRGRPSSRALRRGMGGLVRVRRRRRTRGSARRRRRGRPRHRRSRRRVVRLLRPCPAGGLALRAGNGAGGCGHPPGSLANVRPHRADPDPDVWHDWGSIIRITPSTHKTNRYVQQIVRYCRQFGIDKEIIQALDAPPRGPIFPTSTRYVTTSRTSN